MKRRLPLQLLASRSYGYDFTDKAYSSHPRQPEDTTRLIRYEIRPSMPEWVSRPLMEGRLTSAPRRFHTLSPRLRRASSDAQRSELGGGSDDLVSESLHVSLDGFGVTRDCSDHHLVNPRVAISLHFIQTDRRANSRRD